MLANQFVSELFRPQAMYKMNATKEIFKKLAHSSIMKLNDTSMQKLYDLMVMGLKYQVQMTVQPEELYFITINHLKTMQTLVAGTQAEEHVIQAKQKFEAMCASFGAYDWMVIRQQMYKFFEDRHIKVSLFIQDKIQGLDGTIYLDFSNVGPQFSVKPGKIRFFNPASGEETRSKQINIVHSTRWSEYELPAVASNRMSKATKAHLGGNIYAAERTSLPIPWKPNTEADKEIETIKIKKAKREEEEAKLRKEESKGEESAVTEEFNQLASLLGK